MATQEIDLGNVQGPKGDTGPQGPQGEQGPEGPQGPPGEFDMDAGLTFTEASARQNINTGESLKTILGKVKKFFTDLKPHAFSNPVNNLTGTDATLALAATQGKALDEKIKALNSALTFVNVENNPDLFGKNFLLINATQEHGIAQTTTYFSKPEEDSDWQNIPYSLQGKQWIGIRKVYRRNNIHVLVEIIEMYPVAGRLWYIFYNNELWTHWRSIMPTELS